ncbi:MULTISPECIES: gephyrin-like molybdotransferase Glp [unclassified Rhizobium]|uniref:molybdopterin molybdotransferase MoeA n=1 Tax=unclassified Rhizobium TaxID=2613769 RepID=UPI000712D7BB|nr:MULTISPECIES: gephyrin-like molybdotransferase Glp [unclassified Rhizobium]KQS98361.1 molybdenum cofactor biosynthesis protein MoaA [Rhizobium sp. Leaf391]KQT04155.1 molybdenum cofactor biosynthesis protein MoaA [Rhizobium sp. Leaf386]KQT95410.1 molybdenum cofactor biosynthesis protein MoaA [Rhizobium sp. Leaf453]
MSLLPVADALARLLAAAKLTEKMETVGLHEGMGRVLAKDLAANLTHPAFDNSAMDGYAGRHADFATVGSELRVIGQSAAGHGFTGTVGPGEVVRIFTGAPVPAGADTVLIQEDAETLGDGRIRTTFAPAEGRHIRRKGQDFKTGDSILRRGDMFDAGRLTVAAGMNVAELPVYVRPKVAILATGDELLPPGSIPGPDQIIASNTYGVAALARDNGAEVIDLGIVRDDPDAIAAAVAKAQASGADVLVTLGGASVGDHDLVQSTLIGSGMELDFWRIAMRPGKPLMVGTLGGMQVLGLPGNPVSSLVCALLFLEPLVRRLSRLPTRNRTAIAATEDLLAANDKRQDYVRARLTRNADGGLIAHPFSRQDSSMMQVFAQSDCLIVRPPHAPEAAPGTSCDILMLRDPAF